MSCLVSEVFGQEVCYDGFDDLFRAYAGSLWRVVKAICYKESRYNPNIPGKSGEIGLMQIMPGIALEYWGIPEAELWDPKTNIWIGTSHFLGYLTRYEDDFMLAIVAYNYGGGNVDNLLSKYGTFWFHHLPQVRKDYYSEVRNIFKRILTCEV